jgi:hypothetical protein
MLEEATQQVDLSNTCDPPSCACTSLLHHITTGGLDGNVKYARRDMINKNSDMTAEKS